MRKITNLIRSLVRRNNRVALTLFPRMFRYKAFGVVETGSGYPRRPEHQESKVCLLAGYLRVQEEIRASQARLALLNTEIERRMLRSTHVTKFRHHGWLTSGSGSLADLVMTHPV